MILNFHKTLDDMCEGQIPMTTDQAKRVLAFARAMKRCLNAVTCDSSSLEIGNVCELAKEMRQKVPLNNRHLDSKFGITMSDLDIFNSLHTEKEMYQEMKLLWLKVNLLQKPATFEQLLAVIFVMQSVPTPLSKTTPTSLSKTTPTPLSKTTFTAQKVITGDIRMIPSRINSFTPGAAALLFAQKSNRAEGKVVDPPFELNKIRGLRSLLVLLDEFIQLPATEFPSDSFWERIGDAMEDYAGSLYLENKNLILEDKYVEIAFMISRFAGAMVRDPTELTPVFKTLAEDIIVINAMLHGEQVEPLTKKWKNITHGLLPRIKHRLDIDAKLARGLDREPLDSIWLVRHALKFFPTPYKLGKRSVNGVLTSNCIEWELTLAESKKESPDNTCGCNCVCSTTLGMMLANEFGLLGTRIHVIRDQKHVYLGIGNRETDWHTRSLVAIETTARYDDDEETCAQTLMQLSQLDKQSYTEKMCLVPNYYEFYVDLGTPVDWDKKTELIHDRVLIILSQTENLYGFGQWYARNISIPRKKKSGKQIIEHANQLLAQEAKKNTLPEMNCYQYLPVHRIAYLLFDNGYEGDDTFANLFVILKRMEQDPRFGPASDEFIWTKQVYENSGGEYT